MRRPVLVLVAACAAAAGVAGCGGSDGSGSGGSGSTSVPASSTAGGGSLPAGCRRVAQPAPRQNARVPRPRGTADRGATVSIATTCGTFSIRLAVGRAPRTASSFAGLVQRGFYDGLTFHRIAAGPTGEPFVIQGGDPLGSGLGGPGFTVVEPPPAGVRYTQYTVAMAKTGAEPAGASGSQFFVVTADDAGLPPDYALVGRVTDGRDVVDRIASVPADAASGQPVAPVVIEKATLSGS